LTLLEGKKPKFHYKFTKSSSGLNDIKSLKEKYKPQLPASKFTLSSKVIIEGGQNITKKESNENDENKLFYDEKYFNKIRLLENENSVLKTQNNLIT